MPEPTAETTETTETTETGTETTAETTETAAETTTETVEDLRSKFEAQQKVNRDLERKYKAAAASKDKLTELESKLAALEGKEAEYQASLEAQRIKDEALGAANERILKAEVRAVAAGKLSDPADALLYLNLSDFEVGSDGEVDSSLIASAIDDLIKNKPYLAAQGGKRFQGTADGGTRNESANGPSQLNRADLERMSPAEIDKATREGRFADLMAGKR